MLSALGVCHQCIGVYHDLCGGISLVHCGDIMSALKGYHNLCGGYHQCIGGLSRMI